MLTIQQTTAKPEIKFPGQRLLAALQTLPAMLGCHSGQKLAPVPGSSYHTACLIALKRAVRGISYANMMLSPTKGLFMHSSYLLTLGGSFR